MGFPKDVRTRALVAAARHCCVCHRYKGVKVEVHHVETEALGGSDEFDNAITLCFDCHADAGHYNPSHPRGTKYSPNELRMQRDRWHEMVEKNNISVPTDQDSLYCRYLVCKSFEILREIANNDLCSIPAKNPLLIKNASYSFLKSIISAHPSGYRHSYIGRNRYNSLETYLREHLDATKVDKTDGKYSYYDTIRVPSIEELKSTATQDDGIVRLMLEKGIPPEEIVRAVGYREDCGGGLPFQEKLIFRPFWGVFLAATNISNDLLTLEGLEGEFDFGNSYNVNFRVSPTLNGQTEKLSLPKAPLLPGATAIIPVITILAPIQHVPINILSQKKLELQRGQVQETTHCEISKNDLLDFRTWGPSIFPSRMIFNRSSKTLYQEIHELDLSNMYVIDRFWEMGSCPHIFFFHDKLHYAREILGHWQTEKGEDFVKVPDGVRAIVLVELEEEFTEIDHVKIDGRLIASDLRLSQGDIHIWPAKPGSIISFYGRYIHRNPGLPLAPDPSRRNSLVCEYLIHQNAIKRIRRI